jgi:hypothetical protein
VDVANWFGWVQHFKYRNLDTCRTTMKISLSWFYILSSATYLSFALESSLKKTLRNLSSNQPCDFEKRNLDWPTYVYMHIILRKLHTEISPYII